MYVSMLVFLPASHWLLIPVHQLLFQLTLLLHSCVVVPAAAVVPSLAAVFLRTLVPAVALFPTSYFFLLESIALDSVLSNGLISIENSWLVSLLHINLVGITQID